MTHYFNSRSISPVPEKIDKVKCFPAPHDVTQVRPFLGLGNYLCAPSLQRLLHLSMDCSKKENTFAWTSECETAFMKLKEGLLGTCTHLS